MVCITPPWSEIKVIDGAPGQKFLLGHFSSIGLGLMEKSALRKVTAAPFASILMILVCQCFLFEEQFNKQSLAFHVEGKICNDIHLPGSSSSACE
jgi:hypothetical protein